MSMPADDDEADVPAELLEDLDGLDDAEFFDVVLRGLPPWWANPNA